MEPNCARRPLVLNVDDSEAARYVRTHALTAAGYDVAEAATGRAALERAQQAPYPDIIVLDIRLPDMDGFEVCRQLKQAPETRNIPVLHVSSLGEAEPDYLASVASGGDAYLREPMESSVLIAMVRILLRSSATHKALVDVDAQLRSALRAAHLGTWEYHVQTDTAVILEPLATLFGFPEAGERRPIGEFFSCTHPADRERVRKAMDDALAHGTEYVVEYRVPMADGSVRLFMSRGEVIRNASGTPERVLGAVIDLTERAAAEAALVAAQERLEIAKEAAALGIHDWNIVTGELDWDARVRELWGVAPGVPIDYRTFIVGLHPDDREPTQRAVDGALDPAGDGTYSAEYRVIHRSDGQTRWIFATGQVFFDAGRPVRLVGTVQDITDRKRTEEEIRERESELRQIADSMPQMIWVSNIEGRDEYHNRRWYDYTGLTPPSPDWSGIIHPDDLARTAESWRRSLATGEPYEIEYRLKRHDGQFRWFLGRAEPIRDSEGAIVRWFGTCTDIHDQRLTADDLRRANQDLQQFAYAASHDLQEPLRAVTSYTQLLNRRHGSLLDEEGQQYIKFTLDGATRLQSLLQDLRTFWATGVQSSEPEASVDIQSLIDEVTANLGHQLRRSGAEIHIDSPMPVLNGHRTMFVQLFQNLVSNAIKYRSPDRPARVEISAELKRAEWVFHVADNGIGIDPKHFPKLFRVFSRLHGGTYEGTGLGLAICQRIVERMSGRIWVESEPGKGSRFSFAVPVPAVDIQSARG